MNEIAKLESVVEKTPVVSSWRSRKSVKVLAMYCSMVTVSTMAIFFLEHSTLVNAFRTALVAAIAKTFAANWVSGIFE